MFCGLIEEAGYTGFHDAQRRAEGGGELMVGRNRERSFPRQFQEPSEVLGFAPEFLPNRGDPGSLALRFKRSDQALEPRAQLRGVESFVIGEPREIAEQPAEAAQSGGLRFLRPFPRAAPQGRDLVVEKREARVRET